MGIRGGGGEGLVVPRTVCAQLPTGNELNLTPYRINSYTYIHAIM